MVAHTCDPSAAEAEAGGREFKESLDYMKGLSHQNTKQKSMIWLFDYLKYYRKTLWYNVKQNKNSQIIYRAVSCRKKKILLGKRENKCAQYSSTSCFWVPVWQWACATSFSPLLWTGKNLEQRPHMIWVIMKIIGLVKWFRDKSVCSKNLRTRVQPLEPMVEGENQLRTLSLIFICK